MPSDIISRSCYNLSTPILQFPTFSLVSQREREAMKDERTHYGAVTNLNQNNRLW